MNDVSLEVCSNADGEILVVVNGVVLVFDAIGAEDLVTAIEDELNRLPVNLPTTTIEAPEGDKL